MAKTEYEGIDYGMGQTNLNPETGIRYGVINQSEVLESWADKSEPVYPDAECQCGETIDESELPYICQCGEKIDEWALDCMEPLGFVLDDGEYKAECGEMGDIFVMESPYFTYAQFCSPCAPGACYLTTFVDKRNSNNRAYCFGHDWFDDGKAPYPVYSVKTGELVDP